MANPKARTRFKEVFSVGMEKEYLEEFNDLHADILNDPLQLVKEMFIVAADQTNTKKATMYVDTV